MPRFWLQADISLLKVLPGFRIPAGGMNDIERLSEAHVEMKPDRSRAVVDRDHSHVDVRRIGAQIEVAQAVESGRRVVEVCVDVAVKHEAKVGAPLREGRLRPRGSEHDLQPGQPRIDAAFAGDERSGHGPNLLIEQLQMRHPVGVNGADWIAEAGGAHGYSFTTSGTAEGSTLPAL